MIIIVYLKNSGLHCSYDSSTSTVLFRELGNVEIGTRFRGEWQFPSVKIGTEPTGPADPGNGHYGDPKRDFEGAPFL